MTGGRNVTITADAAPPRAGDLVRAIETIEPIVVHLGEEALGASMSPIRWVICEDFAAEVAADLDPTGGNTYSGDRVGGEVAAKTMVDPDHGGYAIYLNGRQLCDGDEAQSELSLMFLIAHEANHVLQYDTRRISAVADKDSSGGMVRRAARFIGHFAVDEYRADAVASVILAQAASVTDTTTGISRSASPQDTFAFDHLAGFEAAVLGMYPTLADTVDDYRNHRISLEALLEIVIPHTDQFVTLAAHWQALCDCLTIAEPWSLGDLPDAPAATCTRGRCGAGSMTFLTVVSSSLAPMSLRTTTVSSPWSVKEPYSSSGRSWGSRSRTCPTATNTST